MDIKNYIESGIIESYVLGITTTEESVEVEALAKTHPDIKQAILNVEILFENQISKDIIQPPAHIKSNISNILFSGSSENVKPVVSDNIKLAPVRNINASRYIAAAAVVLLIISTSLNFYFYSSFKSSTDKYEALLIERNTLQANNASYKTRLDEINQSVQSLQNHNEEYKNRVANLDQSFRIMRDPNVKEVKLKGVLNKTYLATVYWNTQTKEVYFFKNNLKETPSGKQYQLWAIVHGKPVNAGVIDICSGLCKMKVIPDAQAFAITLEKQGGSETPTLTAMAVMGKVS